MRFPLTLLAVLVIWGCASETRQAPIVARVGGVTLTVNDLKDLLPAHLIGTEAEEDRRHFVEKWVEQQLLYQEALDRGTAENARVGQLLERARRDLLVAWFLDEEFDDEDVEVDDVEVQTYHDAHRGEFTRSRAEIRIEHILLGSRRDANALRQALVQGDDFADAAREHSLDRKTSDRGGYVGYFSADDDPDLWEACQSMALNKISKPVATEDGFHIIRVLERQESGTVKAIEQVRPQIVEALVRAEYRRRLEELIEQLKSRISWSIDDEQLANL